MKLFIVASLLLLGVTAQVGRLPNGSPTKNAPAGTFGQCYGLSLPRSCPRTSSGACDGHDNAQLPLYETHGSNPSTQCYVPGSTQNVGQPICAAPENVSGERQEPNVGPQGGFRNCCVADMLASYLSQRSVCRPNQACFTWQDTDGHWYLDIGISPKDGEPCCVYCADLTAAQLAAHNPIPNGPDLPCCAIPGPTSSPTPRPTPGPTPSPTPAPTPTPNVCPWCCQTFLFPPDLCDAAEYQAENDAIAAANAAAQAAYEQAVANAQNPGDANFLCSCTAFANPAQIPDQTNQIPRSLCCKIAGPNNDIGCTNLSCNPPVPQPPKECPTCTCITDTGAPGFPLFPQDRCISSGHVCECAEEEEGPRTRYPFKIQECTKCVEYNIKSDTRWKNDITYIIRNEIHVEAGARLFIEPGTVVLFENFYRAEAGKFPGRIPVSQLVIDSGASLWARDVEFRANYLTGDQVTGGVTILGTHTNDATQRYTANPRYTGIKADSQVTAPTLNRRTKLVRPRFVGLGSQGLGLPALAFYGVGPLDGRFEDITIRDSAGAGFASWNSDFDVAGISVTRGEDATRTTAAGVWLGSTNARVHETFQVSYPKVAPGVAVWHDAASSLSFSAGTTVTLRTDSATNSDFALAGPVTASNGPVWYSATQ